MKRIIESVKIDNCVCVITDCKNGESIFIFDSIFEAVKYICEHIINLKYSKALKNISRFGHFDFFNALDTRLSLTTHNKMF